MSLVPEPRPQTISIGASYGLATAFILVGLALPPPEGSENSFLVTLVVAVMFVVMIAVPRIALAVIVLAFPLGNLRLKLGTLEFPFADLATLALVASHILSPTRRIRIGPLLKWYLPVVVAAIVSGLLADDRAKCTYYAIRFYGFLGIVYLGFVLPAIREDAELCLRGIRWTFLYLSLAAIGLAFYRIFYQHDLWSAGELRAGPLGEAQEIVGIMVAVLMPVVSHDGRARRLSTFVEMVGVVAIIGSFAKTAWLIWLGGILIDRSIQRSFVEGYEGIRRGVRRILIALPIVLGIAAAALTALFIGSIGERMAMWVGAAEYFFQRPWFGFGPGTVGDLLQQSAWIRVFLDDSKIFPTDAHGFPIKLLPEIGIFGFLAYCGFLVRALRTAVESLRTRIQVDYAINGAALTTLVSAILMISVGTDTLSARSWFVFALVIGLLRHDTAERTNHAN